jgi:hypothetical protein
MIDWPHEYDDKNLPRPHFTVQQAKDAGFAMASRMVASTEFAERFLQIVKRFYAHHDDYSRQYLDLMQEAIDAAQLGLSTDHCNENDYANIYRAAWLYLFGTFARLVDKNPHLDGEGHPSWGDPPITSPGHRGISRGEDDLKAAIASGNQAAIARMTLFDYHNIPNTRGAFALSSDDILMPSDVR